MKYKRKNWKKKEKNKKVELLWIRVQKQRKELKTMNAYVF